MQTRNSNAPQKRVIHALLAAYNLTHEDLARKLSGNGYRISRAAVSFWLNGATRPNAEGARRLEAFFGGLSLDQLLAPASLDGNDVVVLFRPKTHVECPQCKTSVKVL